MNTFENHNEFLKQKDEKCTKPAITYTGVLRWIKSGGDHLVVKYLHGLHLAVSRGIVYAREVTLNRQVVNIRACLYKVKSNCINELYYSRL